MKKVAKKVADIKTKYGTFRCVFETERDMGGYTAEAPAVQGAVSWGKNLAHAKKMIEECIEGVIETRIVAEAVKEGNVRFTANAKRIPSFARASYRYSPRSPPRNPKTSRHSPQRFFEAVSAR